MTDKELKYNIATVSMNAEWLANRDEALREQIAKEIEASKVPLSGLIHDLAFNDAIRLAAAIARGQK